MPQVVRWLQKANYSGHVYFDTFPLNEDPVREVRRPYSLEHHSLLPSLRVQSQPTFDDAQSYERQPTFANAGSVCLNAGPPSAFAHYVLRGTIVAPFSPPVHDG